MASSKDIRTYQSIKEHGQDMTLENEVTITNDDRSASEIDTLKKENEKLKKDMDILTDRQTIELLTKDKELETLNKVMKDMRTKLCKCKNDK
tara:strand:+ start:1626 stop:1901 length:276 start_codon:yes stop_codon:yes gene_type:complete